MTEKRYYCDNSIEYRSYGIFDLNKADKSIDDFRDEDGICGWQFSNYLVDETDSMLNGEEVVNKLNKQEERIKELEKKNAFLTVEIEALKKIKPIIKLPQKLTVLKLDDGDVE